MKKLLILVLVGFLFIAQIAQTSPTINAYFFWGNECPHCAKEKIYLQSILSKYPTLKVHSYEVYYNEDNVHLMELIANTLGVDAGGVPFLIIGDKPLIGFAEGITSIKIDNLIESCVQQTCSDSVRTIVEQNPKDENILEPIQNTSSVTPMPFKLPILGEIDIGKVSLPLLTIILGVLDGFNPCAMWILLFLISLLLGLNDRKRMWILGTTFIVISALVYFIFMAAWLNIILFIGYLTWVKIAIGLLALIAGIYSICEFKNNPESGCKVTGSEKRQQMFAKIRKIISQNSFWLALGGIVVLAFMVNLVELICSAGLPAIYTQVLAVNNIATWQYYVYIFIYIFFFMLDDLFVFFSAMITLQLTGITTKYSRYSRLVGGVLMLIIGLLLIFKPEWLMFG